MSSFTRPLAITMILFISVLMVPAPVGAALIRTTDQTVRDGANQLSGWLLSVFRTTNDGARERKGMRPSPAPTRAEREAKVAKLELNIAAEVELKSRQRLQLSAIPVDADGNAIQGLVARWESSAKDVVFVRQNGEVVGAKPGVATLKASAGSRQATVRVRVVEGTKEPFGGKKRFDSKRSPGTVAQNRSRRQKRAHPARAVPFIRDPNDDPLPDNETSSLYQPSNLIGTPPGKKKPGALSAASSVPVTESGNRNFTLGLPVVSLPGRRIDVSLALVYNSLVWNKSTNPSDSSTWVTYDVDSGYPAQGFRLGYGQIEDQGT